jgi:hypothetical protein
MCGIARASVTAAVRVVTTGALLWACTQAVQLPPPRAFNRPSDVAFVCVRGQEPVPLSECAPGSDGRQPEGFSLLALISQQTRGEVAAVDLSANPPRILDSDRRVPGFTFVEVGEIPIAVAVSETNPACVFVANRGSRDLTSIETVRFLDESRATFAIEPPRSLRTVDAEGDRTSSGRPAAMVLVERGATRELWVALPEDGALARIPVTMSGACAFGEVDVVPLPADPVIPEPPSEAADPAAEVDSATLAVCPPGSEGLLADTAPSAELEPPPPPEEIPPPEPMRIVIERDEAGEAVALLVADASRPMIHRYDLATGSFDAGFRTDGPVRDFVLTPPVPDSLAPGAPTRRYLYAIDDRDGSVMVLEHGTGRLLPVQPATARRPDRLPFRGPARALAVIASRDGGVCTADALPAPDVLRGVFVAVAFADGTVRIVDVFDRDAICRSGDGCTQSFVGNEQISFVRRHRPRIGQRLANGVALLQSPSATREGAQLRYGEDGTLDGDPAAPAFALIECPPGLGPVFAAGDPRRGRICGVTDPWSSEPESFRVAWQGGIPGTGSAGGNLREVGDGLLAVDSRIDACARGVLGPSPEYPGDLLAIVGTLPEDTATDPICRALVASDVSARPQPILVPIADVRVGADVPPPARTRILVRADEPVLDRAPVRVGDGTRVLTMEDVARCYAGELLAFELRVRGAFAVTGSSTGFAHRVVADPEGRCVIDESLPAEREGRAYLGQLYVGPRLAFRLDPGPETPRDGPPPIEITFELRGVPIQLGVDFGAAGSGSRGSLPRTLVWSPLDQRLYGIDETRRGLVVMSVAPLSVVRAIE